MLQQTINYLDDLIAFPSVSSDSNLDLIAYVEQALQAAGARTVRTHDADGGKANVFGTIGPDVDGGVVLSGHTDVVPVAGQNWSADPFTALHRDGRIYGRGSCDMKGFIAAALTMAPYYAKHKLAKPVHFAFTFDEETGCLGAPLLIEELCRTGPKPAVAIVGEPTSMRVIKGHKGCYEFTTEITGLEGHGSLPQQGVNAVEYAARYISRLIELGDELRRRAPADCPFDPPWATVSVGQIHGGIARNVIAKRCTFEWEMRPVVKSDGDYVLENIQAYARDELLPRMRAVYADANLVTTAVGAVDGLEPMTNAEAVALTSALTGRNDTGLVSFGTEAGLFQEMGIATVVCGPGSIEQAHRPDEYVEQKQLNACLNMLGKLGDKLAV